ncbi:hypothetical protein, partial [Streptomyces sporangiiformans]|uniref:hypothetical protein n=1 Tax=Streptomyces sporangiiformans TaxID=2315329 RepID=UPI0019699052
MDATGDHDPGAGTGAVDKNQGNIHCRGAEVGGQAPAGLLTEIGPQRADGQGHALPRSNSGRGAAVCGDEVDRLGGAAFQGEVRGD